VTSVQWVYKYKRTNETTLLLIDNTREKIARFNNACMCTHLYVQTFSLYNNIHKNITQLTAVQNSVTVPIVSTVQKSLTN
jgi:hypothetical protein